MNKGSKGVILASAVAALFIASAGMAQDSGSASSSASQGASVKCVGANSCKGQSSCKSAQNSCKGFVMTSSQDQCTQQGGHPAS
jgi:hypothetical protein